MDFPSEDPPINVAGIEAESRRLSYYWNRLSH